MLRLKSSKIITNFGTFLIALLCGFLDQENSHDALLFHSAEQARQANSDW